MDWQLLCKGKHMTNINSQQNLYKILNEKVKAITDAISAAETFATEHKLSFALSLGYGMSGTFYPEISEQEREKLDDIGEWHPSESGWISSSSQC